MVKRSKKVAQQHNPGSTVGHQFIKHSLSRLGFAYGFAVDGKNDVAGL